MASKTFCPLPWNFLAIRNNGDLRVCCQANISQSKGVLQDKEQNALNARSADLEQARNSPLMKSVRKQMLKGEWPETCVRCQQEEASGLTSRRMYEGQAWSFNLEKAQQLTQEDGFIDPGSHPIEYLDIRFGNKCNLGCRMCGPADSDFWYKDHIELSGKNWFQDTHGKVFLKSQNKKIVSEEDAYSWYESKEFWQQLELLSGEIRHIYFAGGEPLLIHQHYEFLEKLISSGEAKNIVLEYNTNGTVLPQKVLNLWSQFKLVRIGLSLDGIGPVLEYQRYPAKWPTLEKNIRRINQLDPVKTQAWIACTVTIYNILHLPDFIDWKLQAGIDNINRGNQRPILTHHMAHRPHHLNVRTLPPATKQFIKLYFEDYLKKRNAELSTRQNEAACKILNGVSNYMFAADQSEEYWGKFLKYTQKLDQIRNQNFQAILPEGTSDQFFSQPIHKQGLSSEASS